MMSKLLKSNNYTLYSFSIWALLMMCPFFAISQINVSAGSTSQQLKELIQNHGANITFSENLVESCPSNPKKDFKTIDIAVSEIASGCNLKVKRIGKTYIITKPNKKVKKKLHVFSGVIFDSTNNEPLPFSTIYLENGGAVSDENGRFTIKSTEREVIAKISHMGFAEKSVIFTPSRKIRIPLHPENAELKAVDIIKSRTELLQNGPDLSQIKLNHKLNNFLPGNRNNTLFNLMRLQSGIMASGEPYNDFVIRGSYKGFNHILFDDITIFNPSSLNSTIGEFNPMIVREIDVYKSGYQVDKGDRANGLIHISAKNGDSTRFRFDSHLSNQAFSNYFNFPLKRHGAIQLAYRVAYPDLFQPITYSTSSTKRNFLFGDINFKYHGTTKSGDQIRFTAVGNRNQSGIFTDSSNSINLNFNNYESVRYQAGANFSYFKNWKKGAQTKLKLSYSISDIEIGNDSKQIFENDSIVLKNSKTNNAIHQGNAELTHDFSVQNQHISFGAKYTFNLTNFSNSNLIGINEKSFSEYHNRFSVFFKDRIYISKYFEMEPGVKVDMVLGNFFPFWQPRIKLIGKPNKHWRLNFSYGIYNQFINENPLIDENQNTIYYWSVGTNNKTSAHHYVGGISYSKKFFSGSIEGYFISTKNISRLFISDLGFISSQYGSAETYGVDFNVNFKINKHLIWASYSLRESKETFLDAELGDVTNWAPQDQRHEFKVASILKFHPFYVTGNYVFGSGFRGGSQYHRMDLGFMYKYRKKKLNLETGFSILNVTNRKNQRLNNFVVFNENEAELQRGIPISPSVFLRIFI